MSILDSALREVTRNATVQNLATNAGAVAKYSRTAIAAAGQAHTQEADAVGDACAATGLPPGELNEIVDHIGGEGSLSRFASLFEGKAIYRPFFSRIGSRNLR